MVTTVGMKKFEGHNDTRVAQSNSCVSTVVLVTFPVAMTKYLKKSNSMDKVYFGL